MSDIRKWFMKQHDKNNNGADKKPPPPPPSKNPDQETSAARRKTSKYFAKEPETKNKDEDSIKPSPAKRKISKVEEDEEDDDFERASEKKKKKVEVKPAKKLKKDESDEEMEEKEVKTPVKAAGRGRGVGGRGASSAGGGRGRGKKSVVVEESDDDDDDYVGGSEEKDVKTPTKPAGRGRGGGGRGRGGGGGGRGGFMNFGERKDPPHKGEKEVPDGAPGCLSGLTFVISGTLDSLEREEAEDLIKRHGGRVTGSVSKKTNYLLADEDIGGRKSEKAKELGTKFLTEDGLFDMIRKSKPAKAPVKEVLKNNSVGKAEKSPIKSSPVKVEAKDAQQGITSKSNASLLSKVSPSKQKARTGVFSSSTWTEKYKPKVPNEIIGNQSIVKQLHDWLSNWHNQFLHSGQKGKGKKQNDSGSKKAVLLSGTPGIGKSTSAKLISIMLGFQPIEVNASDSRGKADSKIVKGVGGSTSNSIKELINNEALGSKNWSKHPKTVLIMDEVDGMSAGDRGGVADLIASIKISKIPVICICNDRYSQKLKSLVNHCLLLTFRKPTKQQMAKRLMQIATAEGLKTDEIALEELADRVNGDMRMAINQLQYMSLSHSAINYDDIRQRLLNSSKDEDISPFTAVDKLFGFNAGKLRMDERIDLSMSDPDLVPLIIQENYINYRPASMGKDESGVKRLNFLARAAESIGDGDIVNVQIRRYRQWQLSQAGSFASSIIPAALMHGQRETLEPGERNYNRFGGWLGKNSTMGKNSRLLQDAHVHILASQCSNLDRVTLRLDYLSLLLRQLTEPLKTMPKDAAVQEVVKFMEEYSLSQEDFETIIELSKFQGHPNPMEGVQPAVKAALTKAYKSSSGAVRAADLITLPGFKKPPKKRIAAILEPVESVENGFPEENGDTLADSEEENSSDAEDDDGIKLNGEAKPKLDLQSDRSKGIQVQLDLKTDVKGKSSAKKTPTSRAKAPAERGSQSSGRGGKRKR